MISVIMLTYNREALVSRAIESILAQSYADFEYIIVDNGSTDRSGQTADEYAARDSRIRVIHKKKGNIGSGRNAGLDAARGSYVTFLDDDDWVEPDYLEFLLGLAENNGAEIAICGSTDKAFEEQRIMSAEEALIELMWRKLYSTGFPMKLFDRKLLAGHRFSGEDHFDDIGIAYQLFAGASKVAYHGLPKYHVLRHSGNNSAWTTDHTLLTSEILDEYLHAYRTRTAWLTKQFPNSAPAWRYFEWSFMLSMIEKIYRLNLDGCQEQLTAMVRELRKHRSEFLEAPETLSFEKEWVNTYVPNECQPLK